MRDNKGLRGLDDSSTGVLRMLARSPLPLGVVVLLCCTALLGACAEQAVNAEHLAARAGLEKRLLHGEPFDHVIYFNPASGSKTTLHVYLSGDGTPWITRTRIAADPTPRNPIALRLMAMDPSPSLFLGRPCYHGLAHANGCDASLWTSARYSEAVVASMSAALRSFVSQTGYRNLVLIGYSGGGVLAWLIAERMPEVRMLVSIAANLDIDAWTTRHGYSPLTGSLNPARRPPLPTTIAQLHLVGEADQNVPPSLVRAALGPPDPHIVVAARPGDHRCCWEGLWPGVLADIRRMNP